MAQDSEKKPALVTVKKYANRRLYNTDTSTYVTLDDLAGLVRSHRDFVVYDAKSGEDLTHAVLTQIIVEQESKGGENLLPIGFLRQLIRFYGNSMQGLVPSYLEFSIDSLTREQEKYRRQFTDTFGTAAFEAIQVQARQNIEMFERAMTMFSPFGQLDGKKKAPEGSETPPSAGPAIPAPEIPAAPNDEIAKLRSQLLAIQEQLDLLSKKAGKR